MTVSVLTKEDLEKTIIETTKYKDRVETEYFRVLGKLDLLKSQIEMLMDKEQRVMAEIEKNKPADNQEAKPE